jgi:ATP-dependent DNA helicase RecQ
VAEQEIGKQLLKETVAYAESSQCRRKLLLNYFGEDYGPDNCGACDNCLHPKARFDGQEELSLVIELIESLPEHFKLEHLAGILSGVPNAMIKSYRHDQLPLYGAGKDHDLRFWATVIHQGIILHYLDKDIENYGLIFVTEEGKKFFEHPHEVLLVEDRTFSEGTDDEDEDSAAAVRGGGGGDQVLLAMLKDLRKDLAHKLRLQPWIVFSDPSLEDMSIVYPLTLKELSEKCQGVGEGKANKFGKPFVELIAKYVEENEITRPDDFVVKSVAAKSGNKVYIIQAIDRKLDLKDIAASKGLDMDALLTEIEAIVSTGTRINLNYYIEQELDPEVVEEIYTWFKEEAASDSLSDALQALSDDYEELEIRLVRIKFLCEVAN